MTDYSKLIADLRFIAKQQDCNECEGGKWHNDIDCCLFENAASAIETLQADMKTYGKTAFDEGYAMGFDAGEARAEKRELTTFPSRKEAEHE